MAIKDYLLPLRTGLCLAVCLVLCSSISRAQPLVSTNTLPETNKPPVTPVSAKFIVKAGFRLELVAAAPLVESPVAITFDEEGRLYVVENDAMHPGAQGNTRHGRVRRLNGSEGAGTYRTSVLLADDLISPAGLAFYQGGLFIADTPQILYLANAKSGDTGVERRVIFQNLGDGSQPQDNRQLVRDLTWGPDNRIHGLTSRLGSLGGSASPTTLPPGHDFSFAPRNPTLKPEPGGADSGLAFDNAGTRFVSSWDRPLQKTIYQDVYLDRNPYFPAAPAVQDVARAVAIYRPNSSLKSDTNSPTLRPARAGNDMVATWMTNATGLAIYRGNAFPSNYLENAFVADPVAGVVHRFVLRDTGLVSIADRAPDEAASEFLGSRDPSFHPVQVVNGPAGVLYVVDMGDEKNPGAIYRVVPENFKAPEKLKLVQATIVELAIALGHPNGWHRDTAARLLCERGGKESHGVIAGVLQQAKSPLARFHALMVLEATGTLAETNVLRALRDPEPAIRQQGIRLTESFTRDGAISEGLWAQLSSMAGDTSILVRHQLALTLGGILRPARVTLLATLLRRDLGDPWIQTAVLASLPDSAGTLLVGLAQDASFWNNPAGAGFLVKLAGMIGVRSQVSEVVQCINLLAGNSLDPKTNWGLLRALGDGLHRAGSALTLADTKGKLAPIFAQAAVAAVDDSLPLELRVNAIGALAYTPLGFAETGDLLLLLLGSGAPEAMQTAALSTLGSYSDTRIGTNLVARLRLLGPALRRNAVAALLTRDDRLAWTMQAASQGQISWTDFPLESVSFLRAHGDPAVAGVALQIFGNFAPRNRAIEQFLPSLRMNAAPARGRDIFQARCTECHRLAGEGETIGPDLAGAKVLGREKLLFAILEPGAYVRSTYTAHVLHTRTGESYFGLLENPNALTVTLASPGGIRRVFPRANLQSVQAQHWSLMPEGLEAGLTAQDMANLLGYLVTTPR